ncbi:MAG: ROK family protein [Sphingomicrobium sp.]|nr:ROK family protein [Sphingomonadales bacterium]
MNEPAVVAGVELGGTKCIAAIARGPAILDRLRVPTGAPGPTLAVLSDWLAARSIEHGGIAALGIGSFGPVALDPTHNRFGTIIATTKPGWSGVDVRSPFAARFDVPVGFDTDVTGAALAEGRWGASQGCAVHAYVTVGTGIGVGIIVDDRPVHGLLHPEIGHIRVRRTQADSFPGICTFHGDCIEGIASGPAIAARTGYPAGELPADHPVWQQVSAELGEMIAILILTLSPQRILLGGGVIIGRPEVLAAVRAASLTLLGGFGPGEEAGMLAGVIRLPHFRDDAGPLGAIALAYAAIECSTGKAS